MAVVHDPQVICLFVDSVHVNDQAKLLGSLEIHHTHQQIADDLHSSRVVISRLLKQLENKGLIEIHRNKLILKEF